MAAAGRFCFAGAKRQTATGNPYSVSNDSYPVKAYGGDFIDTRFPGWQDGYGAFTKSHSDKDAVIEYIKRQEEHHKRESFVEEIKRLLKEEGVPFDERYLECLAPFGDQTGGRRGPQVPRIRSTWGYSC